jgi:undecaprenyl diphosphate synthase
MSSPPTHVAIIMDGNGRWARERGRPRLEGHQAGAKTVRDIVTYAREMGVRYLTLYAFSSENWGRPEDEVAGLMALLSDYLVEERSTMLDNAIELGTIGAIHKLPEAVQSLLSSVKEATAGLDGMRLTLALSYGSRDELLRGIRSLAEDVRSGELEAADIDEAAVAARLYTHDLPDPDLLIRTSGEQRISNFLLWQLAYAELYFTPVPWPEFTRAHFDEAVASFEGRERRFGLTGEQVQGEQAEGESS